MLDAILNLLFPVSCVICRNKVLERRWSAACPACWSRLTPITPPICNQCGMPFDAIEDRCGPCRLGEHFFDFARSALLFDQACRELIHHLKYADRMSLAQPFGDILKRCLDSHAFTGEVVLPTPLCRARRRQRGFNQAELIARRLQRPMNTRVLVRRKNTPTQTGLTRTQRIANLRGAFEIHGAPPRSVIVVDDVYTTGATLNEIARTLKRAGVQRVEALTVARVPEVQ
jgi:ComF family protein